MTREPGEGERLMAMHCPECGFSNPEGANYFQKCGAFLGRPEGEGEDAPTTMTYKGMMLAGFPNFAFTLGYTNASWTLKADLVSEYVCRLLRHMDARGYDTCMPQVDPSVSETPLLDFTSGYVLRSLAELPKQGSEEPWKLSQNYPLDLRAMRFGPIEDGTMQFSRTPQRAEPIQAGKAAV